MTCIRLCSLIVVAASVAATVPTLAQGPPPGGGTRPPQPPPSNIKVLPKDITRQSLNQLMGQYRGDLGVQCGFCHAQDPTTRRTDYASDANPVKETARFMIAMTQDLNDKYIDNLPGKRYADPITCGTCHRGESHPSVFMPKPQERPAGGPPAGGAAGPPPTQP